MRVLLLTPSSPAGFLGRKTENFFCQRRTHGKVNTLCLSGAFEFIEHSKLPKLTPKLTFLMQALKLPKMASQPQEWLRLGS